MRLQSSTCPTRPRASTFGQRTLGSPAVTSARPAWRRWSAVIGLAGGLLAPTQALQGAELAAGPLYHTFPLTLQEGRGIEALGPLFYRQEREEEGVLWGVPPLVSVAKSDDGERHQILVLPPLFTWRRYGEDQRWQLVQWLNSSRFERIDDPEVRRFNLFPIFFYQDADDPAQDYWALFPLYGTLRNRLFRDEAHFVAFPLWLQTRKRDLTTYNVLFPFFHWRTSPRGGGWQFWPLGGHEHLEPGIRYDAAGEEQVVPGHDKTFALWPLYFRNRLGLGTENPARVDALLPLYYGERSPQRDHTAVLWPLFSWTDHREEKFRQWNAPWPLVGFARGEGKTLNRIIPFFSVGRSPTLATETYLWPLYRRRHLTTESLDRERHQFAVFLYTNLRETNLETDRTARRVDAWPFYTWTRDWEGNERRQILAPIEPLRRGTGIERNWSPLWSLWREERRASTGRHSQSLLWNLYRRDASPASTNVSLLFGLVRYDITPEGRRWRGWRRSAPPEIPAPLPAAD